MRPLRFSLDVRAPQRRRIAVTLDVDAADLQGGTATADGVELFAPTWTPGSYLIREYARHLGPVRVSDRDTGAPLSCRKIGKNRYRVAEGAAAKRLRLEYWVYAHELTVRTADVTPDHAYWNHACVLLWPVGGRGLGAEVVVRVPGGWSCVAGAPVARRGDGEFAIDFADLDAAIDAPVLAGKFTRLQRRILDVDHEVVLDGLGPARVNERFLDHVHRIVEEAAKVFGGPLPYRRYLFLSLYTDAGYGGLEHADSTTLLAARTSMLRGKSYQEFLGLLAHELFHAWNVKRMRPAEFWSYDYENENYTAMLWLAEGFTAYYDDLICRRARLLSAEDYLALVAKNLANLWSGVGRFRQSLAESSHDAWIRHYRPDENTRNSTQNYYGNGALAALVLDLTIRRATHGERSLDDAVAELYRSTYGAGRGYHKDDVVRCLSMASGGDMSQLLRTLTEGALDPDFEPLFASFGIDLEPIDRDRPYLGFALEPGRTIVATVTDDSPAYEAGIAPGDEILALEQIRATSDRWSDILLSVASVGTPLRVLTSSRGILRERVVTPIPAPKLGVRLVLRDEVDAVQAKLRDGWLGAEHTAAD